MSDRGCYARIIRSFIVAIIGVFVLRSLQLPGETAIIVFIVVLVGLLFLADKYFRRLYPDWPKTKNYAGTILFGVDEITIKKNNEQITIPVKNISNLLLFCDHYRGFRNNHRDIERNGNALVYIKSIDGLAHAFKFNIYSKMQFESLNLLTTQYESSVGHYQKYAPAAIPTILTADLKQIRAFN